MMLIPFNDYQLYVEQHGAGNPLLILNGIMMSTASWQPFLAQLKPHAQVILMDLLDQGQSSKCVNQEYDLSLQVEAVYAVIKALKLSNITVCGISYGAEVAQLLTLTYPEAVGKLMIFNSTCKTSEWLKEVGYSWMKAANDPQAFYSATIPTIYSQAFFEKEKAWINNRKQTLLQIFNNREFMDAMVRLTKSAESFDVCDKLNQISVETLVVGSSDDTITPPSNQHTIANRIPNSHQVIINHSGHASMYEQPFLFVSLVLGFHLVVDPGFSTKG